MALGETGLNTPAGLASVVPTAGVGTPDHDFTREAGPALLLKTHQWCPLVVKHTNLTHAFQTTER